MLDKNKVYPIFKEIFPLDYYNETENIEKMNDWQLYSIVEFVNSELHSMHRSKTRNFTKCKDLFDRYVKEINKFTTIFNNVYSVIKNKSEYNDAELLEINTKFQEELKSLTDFINNSREYCEEHNEEIIIEKIEETKIEDTWNPENIDMKYIRAKAYIIMEYEDEKKYFYIKELLQELKEKFKVTKKEFLEIILPQLEKEKRILTQYCIGSNSKTIRYNKADGFRCRVTKFAITSQ